MSMDYKEFKKLGFSFDYEELLEEFISDYNEGLIGEYVFIERENDVDERYYHIVDWHFSEEELEPYKKYSLEKSIEVIEEMHDMNQIL